MLDSNPLSIILFAHIFSNSVGCLLIMPMVSFAMQKLLVYLGPICLLLLLFPLL